MYADGKMSVTSSVEVSMGVRGLDLRSMKVSNTGHSA